MQTSSDKSQPKQDDNFEKANGVDDPLRTIEYLRARLLSERSISKATKERADELAKRVRELEEQLNVVTLQRKRAEKAARDVYSYLDSLGVSEVSEVYESDFDEENSRCESNLDNDETTKDDESVGPLEVRKNDDEQSDSEPESIPSSGRSLSWKGCKDNNRNLKKKPLNSPVRSKTSLAQVNSSPRRRLGRSFRQIKRKESRSTVDESRHESCKSEARDDNAVHDGERYTEKEEVFHSFQAQECDASSSTHEREYNGEMERALQHQAQLIRSYEVQEKAQKDWEEKYAENNDSCEPGSHSDVTEERDDSKVTVLQSVVANPSDGHDQKSGTKSNFVGRKLSIIHFDSFKVSPGADTGSSEKHNVSREMQPATSQAPDFAFAMVNNSNQSWTHVGRPSVQHAGLVDPPKIANGHHKEPARLEMVLGALQEAKLLIKQLNSLPETSNRDVGWHKLPLGCRGLFRVPTDPVDPSPSQSKSDYSTEVTTSTVYGKTLAIQGDQYISSPSGDPSCSTRDISHRHPRFDFHFDTNISSSSRSNSNLSYPDFFPSTSSNQMIGRQFLGSETGIPPSGYPPLQNHDVRPNIYR